MRINIPSVILIILVGVLKWGEYRRRCVSVGVPKWGEYRRRCVSEESWSAAE